MGLITRAMAKKLAANNSGSEASGAVTTEQRRRVTDGKDSAVNADSERDVSERCISADNRGTESSEALNPKIHTESEPIITHASPSPDPKSGIAGRRRRSTKATRAAKPRRATQAAKKKGGSSRDISTLVVSGKISPDHDPSATGVRDATHNDGTSKDTSVVTAGRKRRREETGDADSYTGRDNVSKRAETRRSRRNIQRTTIGEAPSVERKLRDSTNSSYEAKANGRDLPAAQYSAERRSDGIPGLSSAPGPVEVCSGQEEKENGSEARLTTSPEQGSRPKGTCSQTDFVLARTLLTLSRPRIPSRLYNDPGPSGERNETHFPHENPFESIKEHDGAAVPSLPGVQDDVVEAETAPTWEAPQLDPDDFAFLVRRATPYRFEESNVRSEPIIRPAQEE